MYHKTFLFLGGSSPYGSHDFPSHYPSGLRGSNLDGNPDGGASSAANAVDSKEGILGRSTEDEAKNSSYAHRSMAIFDGGARGRAGISPRSIIN